MELSALKFFSPAENSQLAKIATSSPSVLTGYISVTGKLVFPLRTIEQLAIDPDITGFKIGVLEAELDFEIFAIPAPKGQDGVFDLRRTMKGYTVSLDGILNHLGLDYVTCKYNFILAPFTYNWNTNAYNLILDSPTLRGSKPA